MTDIRTETGGGVVVEATSYRLDVAADGMRALLTTPDGTQWAALRPLAAFDRSDGLDETLAVEPPRVDGDAIEVERRSTLWERAVVRLVCTDDGIEIVASVAGAGAVTDVHLLAARSLIPTLPTGFLPSGASFRGVFSPNPGDPSRRVRPAAEAGVIRVPGDSERGRGHWFFTPAPLYLGLTAEDVEDPEAEVAGG